MRKLLALSLALSLIGCEAASRPIGPAPNAGSIGTNYPTDNRVSPHGHIRPTLAASTQTEDVEYYNSNTGTRSHHRLKVDRDARGDVERINFSNGGWKEVKRDLRRNANGTETYVDERGREYTMKRPASADPSGDGEG